MMRVRANVLLSLGTILATLGGARLPDVAGWLVGIGALVLIAGGVMHRMASRKERESGGDSDVRMAEVMGELASGLQALVEKSPSLSLADLVQELDALEQGAMGIVAEAIPQQLAAVGGARFAEIYGEYAAGERLVHRAWSAAADGHREEATRSLVEGNRRIQASLGMLQKAA